MAEVFMAFLRLGLSAFGGPVAHLGYFRTQFVARRRWLDEAAYGDIVALCQFLPGPTSSQTGFAIGLARAGWPGALAAWAGFTLPSAVLMTAFAFAAGALRGPVAVAAVHGLKLAAVAIVAQAVVGMARTLTPDWQRIMIAIGAVAIVGVAGPFGQVAAIVLGVAAGLVVCRGGEVAPVAPLDFGVSRRAGAVCLTAFAVLLAGLPLLRAATGDHGIAVADAFYRSGALVFGGGHVVLPLLRAEVVPPGWIGSDAFLAGYGIIQAMPGPLFSFAAYLGAAIGGVGTALLALLAVFLPGMLLVVGALPFWAGLRGLPAAAAGLRGANAAVVGILAAALYDPVGIGAVTGWLDLALAAAGFAALVFVQAPPGLVVAALVAVAVLL